MEGNSDKPMSILIDFIDLEKLYGDLKDQKAKQEALVGENRKLEGRVKELIDTCHQNIEAKRKAECERDQIHKHYKELSDKYEKPIFFGIDWGFSMPQSFNSVGSAINSVRGEQLTTIESFTKIDALELAVEAASNGITSRTITDLANDFYKYVNENAK